MAGRRVLDFGGFVRESYDAVVDLANLGLAGSPMNLAGAVLSRVSDLLSARARGSVKINHGKFGSSGSIWIILAFVPEDGDFTVRASFIDGTEVNGLPGILMSIHNHLMDSVEPGDRLEWDDSSFDEFCSRVADRMVTVSNTYDAQASADEYDIQDEFFESKISDDEVGSLADLGLAGSGSVREVAIEVISLADMEVKAGVRELSSGLPNDALTVSWTQTVDFAMLTVRYNPDPMSDSPKLNPETRYFQAVCRYEEDLLKFNVRTSKIVTYSGGARIESEEDHGFVAWAGSVRSTARLVAGSVLTVVSDYLKRGVSESEISDDDLVKLNDLGLDGSNLELVERVLDGAETALRGMIDSDDLPFFTFHSFSHRGTAFLTAKFDRDRESKDGVALNFTVSGHIGENSPNFSVSYSLVRRNRGFETRQEARSLGSFELADHDGNVKRASDRIAVRIKGAYLEKRSNVLGLQKRNDESHVIPFGRFVNEISGDETVRLASIGLGGSLKSVLSMMIVRVRTLINLALPNKKDRPDYTEYEEEDGNRMILKAFNHELSTKHPAWTFLVRAIFSFGPDGLPTVSVKRLAHRRESVEVGDDLIVSWQESYDSTCDAIASAIIKEYLKLESLLRTNEGTERMRLADLGLVDRDTVANMAKNDIERKFTELVNDPKLRVWSSKPQTFTAQIGTPVKANPQFHTIRVTDESRRTEERVGVILEFDRETDLLLARVSVSRFVDGSGKSKTLERIVITDDYEDSCDKVAELMAELYRDFPNDFFDVLNESYADEVNDLNDLGLAPTGSLVDAFVPLLKDRLMSALGESYDITVERTARTSFTEYDIETVVRVRKGHLAIMNRNNTADVLVRATCSNGGSMDGKPWIVIRCDLIVRTDDEDFLEFRSQMSVDWGESVESTVESTVQSFVGMVEYAKALKPSELKPKNDRKLRSRYDRKRDPRDFKDPNESIDPNEYTDLESIGLTARAEDALSSLGEMVKKHLNDWNSELFVEYVLPEAEDFQRFEINLYGPNDSRVISGTGVGLLDDPLTSAVSKADPTDPTVGLMMYLDNIDISVQVRSREPIYCETVSYHGSLEDLAYSIFFEMHKAYHDIAFPLIPE